ncbi:unnamed protein product [Darwinula stevensoni]|uniref:Dual specificity protein phosphatase n=1 Tax=Darwinula stevensoni TaxID=69355 RepID=A0A7R8X6A8_9CRUS|nr:unnamed protein product [Darwinula stevensoni]CAG0881093.1 unnamed protein product [Darwinula stevensoni]
MPSIEIIIENCSKMTPVSSSSVTGEWLALELRRSTPDVCVIDCRNPSDFSQSHIGGAVNLTIPTLLFRRFANGKLNFESVIKCPDTKKKLMGALDNGKTIVICDDTHENPEEDSTGDSNASIQSVLLKRLAQDGHQIVSLEGGYTCFRLSYPEWCEGGCCSSEPPLMGLQSLRIDSCESVRSLDSLDSSLGLDDDNHSSSGSGLGSNHYPPPSPGFPVEILPHLFLGNAQNSEDAEALKKHGIQYILNVTPNLPNVFEDSGDIKYMQIPIDDHWSQDVANFFPEAISFIDEARQSGVGVLVHCWAGISRSVTITVAYLMYKLSMSLNEAYDFVRKRKANIAPNFNFMGQLLDFERQLNLSPACSCAAEKEGCRCRVPYFLTPGKKSPDSGIDFDRWS